MREKTLDEAKDQKIEMEPNIQKHKENLQDTSGKNCKNKFISDLRGNRFQHRNFHPLKRESYPSQRSRQEFYGPKVWYNYFYLQRNDSFSKLEKLIFVSLLRNV